MTQDARKSPTAFRTIGEVAAELGLPQHVLRFWEGKFSNIKPHKRRGGHRYYRPQDVDALKEIKTLLHEKGFTIKGAQKFLGDRGTDFSGTEEDQSDLFVAGAPEAANKNLAADDVEKLKAAFNELCELRDLLLQSRA
jgi:DNA-binding transcriptional MerR regulator